jgi:hypothetical protein
MDHTCVVPANSRGGRVLLHNGYRYTRKSKSCTQIRWICTENGCGAFVYTNFFDVFDNGEINIVGKLANVIMERCPPVCPVDT